VATRVEHGEPGAPLPRREVGGKECLLVPSDRDVRLRRHRQAERRDQAPAPELQDPLVEHVRDLDPPVRAPPDRVWAQGRRLLTPRPADRNPPPPHGPAPATGRRSAAASPTAPAGVPPSRARPPARPGTTP